MSQPEDYDPIKLPLWVEPEPPLIAQEDTSTPFLSFICVYLDKFDTTIAIYFVFPKTKLVYKITENRLFHQKTDFFTKIRAKWAKGLLNRTKSVKTDRVNNTAIA